jgi:hypothetical protein
MALDLNALQQAVLTALKKAKDTPPPDDPSQSDQVQSQILVQLSQDLSAAIDTYVRGAVVGGVAVEVQDNAHVVIGSGTQVGTVSLQ